MTEKEKFIVYMSFCEIPNKKQELFLDSLADFSMQSVMKNHYIEENLTTEEFHRFISNYNPRELETAIDSMINSGIEILTVEHPQYPRKLFDLPDRPLLLYAKGDLSLLERKCFAIVGTRTPSYYGKIVTEKFAGNLAANGFVIVSGLCYGVDEIAHKKTLEVGGKTIAIVGSGFNKIYPSTNTELSKEIANSGLLLSEYPPSFVAKRYTFPRRNRIVAGISDGVLVTEANFKSGTVHTKDFALEYGKDIFAVPGNVTSSKSNLTNELIKTAQAHCVTSADDIIQFYGIDKKIQKRSVEVSFDEQKILSLLSNGEKDVEALSLETDIPINILNSCLTTLEIRGLIRRLPAQTYALL